MADLINFMAGNHKALLLQIDAASFHEIQLIRSGLRIPIVTATVAATSNQEDQIGISAKEMYV